MSYLVYVVEVYNNATLEHEVIAYLTECDPERRKKIQDMFKSQLGENEDYSIRFYVFPANFVDEEIVIEALNFARE